MTSELTFIYDAEMRPVAARCSICRKLMPPPPSHLRDAADMVLWLSEQFILHKRKEHPKPLDPDPDETAPSVP